MELPVQAKGTRETTLADPPNRLNVRVGELASAAVPDLIALQDDEFQKAASRVLEKNQELYRRLS